MATTNTEITVKRVAPTNNRVTQGKEYKMVNGYIQDDEGRRMQPALVSENGKTYWEEVGSNTNQNSSQPKVDKMKSRKIETVVLIDGNRASEMNDETLIKYINDETKAKESLQEVKVESKAIAAKIKQCEENIAKLVELLDSRHEDQ